MVPHPPLVDAHQRVMSVGAVQRQLAASRMGDVELWPYLIALTDSIAGPMIPDRSVVSLEGVTARGSLSMYQAETPARRFP